MRVIVVGARGEVGRSVLYGLASHKQVTDVIALSDDGTTAPSFRHSRGRRHRQFSSALWTCSAIFEAELRFADAVIYLGQPHNGPFDGALRRRQQDILSHLCDSVGIVGVRVFAYVSSAAVYAPARASERVDESWPATGATSCLEALQAADCERQIARFEADHPLIRVVRLRPGIVVCPSVSKHGWRMQLLKRLFAIANGRRRGPLVPDVEPLSIQCIHVSDLTEALCLALTRSVSGAFNVAAEPITSALAGNAARSQTNPDPATLPRETPDTRVPPGPRALVGRSGRARRSARRISTRRGRNMSWGGSPGTRQDRLWTNGSLVSIRPRSLPPTEEPPTPHHRSIYAPLYLASLDFFSRAVHAVGDEQWQEGTDEPGLCVWQLVASVARAQYRIALAVRGYNDERIELELPEDPLGIARADGWDLAAERGVLAMDRLVDHDSDDEIAPESTLVQLLAGIICETVRRGSQLDRSLGLDEKPSSELLEFVESHTANDTTVSGG